MADGSTVLMLLMLIPLVDKIRSMFFQNFRSFMSHGAMFMFVGCFFCLDLLRCFFSL